MRSEVNDEGAVEEVSEELNRHVLNKGTGWCDNLNQGHVYKSAGPHYSKVAGNVSAEYERYLTLFCEVCGETIQVLYSIDWSSES